MTLPQILSYTLQTGTIPPGTAINVSTGLLTGTIAPTTTPAPTWVTPSGTLFTGDEGDTFGVYLVATPDVGRTLEYYSVIEKETSFVLPWGAILDSPTGYLHGTLAEVPYIETPFTYPPGQRPTWNPPLGLIILNAYEFDVVSLFLSATANLGTSIVDYTVVDGFLPWGLTINRSNGRIMGTVAQLKSRTNLTLASKTPLPQWGTSSGTLGTFIERQNVSIQLLVTPLLGLTMSSFVLIDGALPWGLTLNSSGLISGQPATLTNRSLVSPASPPVWNTTTLGTRSLGAAVSIPLSASAQIGTLAYYQIIRGRLPWGLTLTGNTISGTISSDTNVTGTFTVTIQAVDSRGANTNRILTMNVV